MSLLSGEKSVLPAEATYSASKGAVNSLTKALAKELAPSHISVNGVSFGVIDTDMNRCFDEEERASLAEEIPYGRFCLSGRSRRFMYRLPNPQNILLGRLYALTVDGFDFSCRKSGSCAFAELI